MATLQEVYKIADKLAPKALSDEYCALYGAYDNSGVLVDTGEKIEKILFSLDLSRAAVEKAIKKGAKLVVTHHPAIYGKIDAIRSGDFDPLGEKLVECIKNGVSVISMHLNLDAAPGGIDESLMGAVIYAAGGRPEDWDGGAAIMHPLSAGGYGRVCDVPETSLGFLAEALKNILPACRLAVYGESGNPVRRAASFCGAGADEEAVRFAWEHGADAIISADFKHHILALAAEKGLAVIQPTHYASENYGFEIYCQKIRERVDVPCVMHTDAALL